MKVVQRHAKDDLTRHPTQENAELLFSVAQQSKRAQGFRWMGSRKWPVELISCIYKLLEDNGMLQKPGGSAPPKTPEALRFNSKVGQPLG